MLELRPICENCACALPPQSTEAWICTFECTFCATCVDRLDNVCPNCGGGFMPRPNRPQTDLKNGNSLVNYPASTEEKHRPVDFARHQAFAARIKLISPEKR